MHYTEHKAGDFSWNELLTTDPKAAAKFYSDVFGWTAQEIPMGGGFIYTMMKSGDRDAGGLMAIPEMAQGMPPTWRSYVTVADVDATAKKAEALGAVILMSPQDIPGVGRFTIIKDPQGAVLGAITYFPKA